MSELKNLFKKFEEPEESDFTSAYKSEKNEEKKLSPKLPNLIEEEQYINNRECTKLGTYMEDYFYLKLKKYLKSKNDFRGNYSITKHIQKINESVRKYIFENAQSNDEESNKIKIVGIDLIKKVEKTFKTKSKNVQIDSFFPCINGKIVKDFYSKINDYSLSSKDFLSNIKEENTYNLLIESTHSITAQINKKRKQLEAYFQLFNNTKKLYLDNKEILKDFYIEFLKYFKVIEGNNQFSDEELINKSNFIYIICSNKNYAKTKLFQESLEDKDKLVDLVKKLSPSDIKKNNEESIENINKTKSGKDIKKKENENSIDKIREAKDKNNGKNDDDKNSKEGELKSGEEGQKEKEKNNKNIQKNGENFKEEDQKEVEENSEGASKDKKKEKNNVKKKTKKIKTDNDSSSNNEENDNNPSNYIDKFKKILEKIGKEEKYLLIYLDSYERLFIPHSVIKDDLKFLKEKFQNLEKNFDAKYEKLKKEYEQFKKESEENNKILKNLMGSHPELFTKNNENNKNIKNKK